MVTVPLILVCLLVSSTVFANEFIEDEPVNLTAASPASGTAEMGKPPKIASGAGIVYDTKSGRVLYSKNAYSRRAIASTTKIMTAVVAIEKGKLEDRVAVSKRAASIRGSTINLKQGQVFTLRELLYGLMLNSGNDAAIAVAEHIGGSVEGFVSMMNAKAVELGLKDTHFTSPHGLDNSGHYSTCFELAKMAAYALQNDTFADIVATRSTSISSRGLNNTNEMLSLYPGADGVKTGYTGQAGRCLVTSVTREGRKIISVVLNADSRSTRARDSKVILDYAFNQYKMYTLMKQGDIVAELPVARGKAEAVSLEAIEGLELPLREDEVQSLQKEILLPKDMEAPVYTGIEAGTVRYLLNGKVLAETALKTSADVERKGFFDYLGGIFDAWTRLVRPEG